MRVKRALSKWAESIKDCLQKPWKLQKEGWKWAIGDVRGAYVGPRINRLGA